MIDLPSQAAFVETFRHLFEHSPWVVERGWEKGPFADAASLHAALLNTVADADTSEQLALIRAHPELGTKVALTRDSESEQSGAGLKSLSPEEFKRFANLNEAYRKKFGFPFIVCVRLNTKSSIFEVFTERLNNSVSDEQARALLEIGYITRLRLEDMKLGETA